VKDLYDDDEILDEMENEGVEIDDESKPKKEANEKTKKLRQKQIEALEDEKFTKEYTKAGGIQHIICSATLTIDKQGRITPRGVEKERRIHAKTKESGTKVESISTVEQLCKILKFRSRNPKVIDLTEE